VKLDSASRDDQLEDGLTDSKTEYPRRRFAAVVAASENDVIGNGGDLPWKMSADLKRFKSITMGHHLIMGRKTLDSIGRILPGRTTVVVTRQTDYSFPDAVVAHSIDDVQRITSDDDRPMIVGGGEIYRMFWHLTGELYLTRIHTNSDGDTKLPDIDWSQWQCVEQIHHPADDRNEFACTFSRCVPVIKSM
jgi:dihydrofolate reductase